MNKFVFVTVTVTSSLVLSAATALAASDYLLEIKGIDGQAAAKSPPQSIEVYAFSWGASNASSTAAGSGGGVGKVNVQDLSVTRSSATVASEVGSGQATGKQAVAASDVAGAASPAAAATSPRVGDVATLTVMVRESPTKASTGGTSRGCAPGKHFDDAVLTASGKRYQMQDVVVTSCTVQGSERKWELKGHVTLIK